MALAVVVLTAGELGTAVTLEFELLSAAAGKAVTWTAEMFKADAPIVMLAPVIFVADTLAAASGKIGTPGATGAAGTAAAGAAGTAAGAATAGATAAGAGNDAPGADAAGAAGTAGTAATGGTTGA